jgi:hypothetical protein
MVYSEMKLNKGKLMMKLIYDRKGQLWRMYKIFERFKCTSQR